MKRLQTNLKINQTKSETISKKTTVPVKKNSTSVKVASITPPTSLKVVPNTSQSAQKRKSSENFTPAKKPKEGPSKLFVPPQTSSPLPTAKKLAVKPPSPKLSPIKNVSPSKGIANARLKELQVSLEKQQSIISDDVLMQQPVNVSNGQCSEDMDWEPSDDLYSSCVSEFADNNNDKGTMSEYYDSIKENSFKISSSSNRFERSYSFNDFYFVVDTNVLLDNLTFVKDLSSKSFGGEFFSTFLCFVHPMSDVILW